MSTSSIAPKQELEKERKYLLKKMPDLLFNRVLAIVQYYHEGLRYRMTNIHGTDSTVYERIRKSEVSVGVNQESEITIIDDEEFGKYYSKPDNRIVHKTRYEYDFKGKTFQIDDFSDLLLVLMEVENVELDEDIDMPEEIKKALLMEVTGNKNFTNYNLGK